MFQPDSQLHCSESREDQDWSNIELQETNELEQVTRSYILNERLQPIQSRCAGASGHYPNRFDSISLGRLQYPDRNYIFIANQLVSRSHCRISLIKNDRYPKISPSFLRFLLCRDRAQQKSALHNLPNNAVRLIFDYASDVYGYHLADEGSRNGTFLQVKKWRTMSKGQVYALAGAGERYELKVSEILNNPNGWDTNYKKKVDDLLQKCNPATIFVPNDPKSNPSKYNLSYMRMCLKLQSVDTHYIVTSQSAYITMGLNCMINLTDPAVPYSGVQSSLKYDKVWAIRDGCEDNIASMFGTWLKLQSESVKLGHEQTIKLGSVIRIDFRYGVY